MAFQEAVTCRVGFAENPDGLKVIPVIAEGADYDYFEETLAAGDSSERRSPPPATTAVNGGGDAAGRRRRRRLEKATRGELITGSEVREVLGQ